MSLLGRLASRIGPRLDPFLDQALYPEFHDSPLVIYDVGAAGSVFFPFDGPISEMTRVYGFEPTAESYRKLVEKYSENPHIEIRQAALTDVDGPVTFYLRKDSLTVSSLLEHSRLDRKAEPVEIEGLRLDSVPTRFGFPPADFVKLDTEGTELMILQSGAEMLRREVLGVFVEIGFWRDSGGGVPFHEVDKYLTDLGFVLYDLQLNRAHFSGIGGKKDKLRSGDALYLRNFTDSAAGWNDEPATDRRRSKLLKLVALCVAWRYLEYAVELLDYGRTHDLISAEEFTRLANRYAGVKDISTRVPDFPGRQAVARLLDALSYALHKNAKKGVPASFNAVGNAWPATVSGRAPVEVKITYPVLGEKRQHAKIVNLNDPSR